MKFYGHPYSSPSRRAQMLCEEAGIPYTFITVDLMGGQQYSPEFQALNPNSKVPVIDDDGFVLWESQAIMRYLADKHKASTWYPTEPKARAIVEQWLDWNHTRLGPEAGKIMYNMHFAGDKGNKDAIEDAKKWLVKILPVLEGVLSKQSYICGAQPTLADLAIVPNIAYLEFCKYDLSGYSAIGKWYEAMKQRPSFVKTTPK